MTQKVYAKPTTNSHHPVVYDIWPRIVQPGGQGSNAVCRNLSSYI